MITQIIKRDGRKVPFDPQKIYNALSKAEAATVKEKWYCERLSPIFFERVIEELHKQFHEDPPTVEDVQDLVVTLLIQNGYVDISQAYITYRYERTQYRDRKTKLMQTIDELTSSDAKDSDLKRDNANVNGNTAMGQMLQYGSAVSKEYALTHMVNKKYAQMHRSGDIHIHDLDFYAMGTLTCCQIDLEKLFNGGFSTGHGYIREPQDIMSYAALAAIAIQSNQNDQHGGQSIPAFDHYMAAGVKKTFRKCYMENLIKCLSLYSERDAQKEKHLIQSLNRQGFTPSLKMSAEQHLILRNIILKEYGFKTTAILKIDSFCYEEALKETERKTYQAMEGLVHNLNTMHSRAGAQVPFSSINFGTDISPEGRLVTKNLLLAQEAGLGNGETPIFPILIFKVKEGVNYDPQDPNYDLFKLSMRVSAKRLFPNYVFIDAPYNLSDYKPNDYRTEIATMGCRTRVLSNVCGESTAIGRGNISFTTINLPRLGIKHGVKGPDKNFDLSGFMTELDEIMDDCIGQLLERYEIQCNKKVKNFPFLMGQGVWNGSENLKNEDDLSTVVKQGTLSVGFIGLAECLVALIGKHHGESEEAQTLGLKIIAHMRKRLDQAIESYHLNFSLLATPAEGLSGRFTQLDKERYGIIEGVTDRDYYTNSNHVPVSYPISAFNKIKIEAPYHALTNAGHIAYVEMDGDPLNNLEAFEAIIRCMKENGVGYGSINHPLDRDPVCGYTGIIVGDKCPKCGRNLSKIRQVSFKLNRIDLGSN